MKKIITVLLIVSMLFCTVACSGTEKEPQITGTATGLTSKMENALELQKSIFICDVLSVSREDAIVPKYNSGITNYSVYNVNITESINGYAPLGEAFVYCMGTSEEFIERIGLKKGERYILDAEPWVYGDKVIYLLAPVTVSFPRIDAAGRVTLATSDTEAEDCGTLEEYKKEYDNAKTSLETRIQGFYDEKQILSRYVAMFENIKKITDANWYRDFDYEWTASEEFVEKTRAYADKVNNYVKALEQKQTITEQDFELIFKQ